MRVLLTGAGGQLGHELRSSAPPGIELAALERGRLDVSRSTAVEAAMVDHRPGLVLNAAAYTAVDRAEEERAAAFAVNEAGAEAVALAARRHGARMIHFSTDFVFDGERGRPYRTDDEPRPLGVYGASKLAGERRVLETLPGALVIRTAWLYSRHGRNFVTNMLRLMEERGEVAVVADQVGSPTWAGELARAVWRLAANGAASGILHWTGAGVASWYDFAVAIAEEARPRGLLSREVSVRPIASREFPTAARRPAYSVLDKSALDLVGEPSPRHWRTALREMLDELAGRDA